MTQSHMAPLHAVTKARDIAFTSPLHAIAATGHTRAVLMDRAKGSVHIGYDLCRLERGGRIEMRVAAYETAVYVTGGTLDLLRDGKEMQLVADDFALIPTGTPWALRNSGAEAATWVDMMAPQPKPPGGWVDTFGLGPAAWSKAQPPPLDLSDPCLRHAAHFNGTMPASFHVHGDLNGFAIRMLMDKEFGAVHHHMFVIEFADGGLCNHHDHPFEEAYLLLSGKVDIVFDGKPYVLEPGDFAWTAVGSRHAFFPKKGQPVRWLEIQAPQPPIREWIRWHERWEAFGRKASQG
jgi:quercetin dioxygenase-like cupin family protein